MNDCDDERLGSCGNCRITWRNFTLGLYARMVEGETCHILQYIVYNAIQYIVLLN
jgi:hypothetical protein